MFFTSSEFVFYFLIFLFLYYWVARTDRQRLWLLLLGSLGFYATWSLEFVPLIGGLGLAGYALGAGISRQSDERKKRALLVAGIALNVGMLLVFKYVVSLVGQMQELLDAANVTVNLPVWSIILPVGLSYLVFQNIAYLVDIYRGTYKPGHDVVQFLVFLLFFPRVLSGPLTRASAFLPQLERIPWPNWYGLESGLVMIASGLVKKTIANQLAPIAEVVFNGGTPTQGAFDTWTGILAYAGQLYGDFSGYTDLALGVAALLGFTLPNNFNVPYISSSIAEYWTRWHISLSNWLRDYLYMPLAFKYRTQPQLVYRALIVTWVIAGLWHGARWTFLLFGFYMGVLLTYTSWSARRARQKKKARAKPSWYVRLGKIAGTFYLINIGNVIARAPTVSGALSVVKRAHTPNDAASAPSLITFGIVILGVAFCQALDWIVWRRSPTKRHPVRWALVIAVAFVASVIFGESELQFIYVRF